MTDENGRDVSTVQLDERGRAEDRADETLTFDCEHCEMVVRTQSNAAMKTRGAAHLELHRAALFEVFAGKRRGKQCHNDCGYVFPVDCDEETGFTCPRCGYDNFEAFAHRYLYWKIDYPDDRIGEFHRR